jgi:hypothetical protein
LGNTGWAVNYGGAGATNNTVKGNVIDNNGMGGVNQNKQNKTFDPNSISGNSGPGIYTDGTYTGSPVLTSATVVGNNITIQGTLVSTQNSSFILEFFGNLNAVTAGNEQGEVFLGTITVPTDPNGNAVLTATFNAVYGNYVSATATGVASTGYTSQFSAYVAITGEANLAAVGGVVWNDLNRTGLQDAGDPGISRVTVKLYDANNNLVATTTTDNNGHYLFTNLAAGQYYVQFTLPAGYAFTQAYQGNNALNSHADPLTGQTELFSLITGQVNPFLSAGLVATS